MVRPTEEEFKIAYAEANRLRLKNIDHGHLGHCYISLLKRVETLEDVLSKTRHFLHSGYAGKEHSDLIRSIERADTEYLEGGDDDQAHPW